MCHVKKLSLAAAFVLVASVASAQQYGGLTAKFVVTGKAPVAGKLVIDKDPAFCGKHKLVDETVVVGKSGELVNAALFLTPALGQKVPGNPALEKKLPAEVRIDNENCRFSPHVVWMTTSQTLLVGNEDPVGHNSNVSMFNNPSFNVIIPGGGMHKQEIPKAETSSAKMTCNIHPWMGAHIIVKDHPYVGISGEDGVIKIDGIPAGEWTFTAWHETGYLQGQQKGKDLGWGKKGRVKVKIESGKVTDLGTIEVAGDSLK